MAHWKNSNFQNEFFIAGQCHTPDEAYRVLRQQREDREVALLSAKSVYLRNEAKISRAKMALEIGDIPTRLEAQADIAEIEAYAKQSKATYDAAVREVEHIDRLIKKINPLRKYSHLTDEEADQACQREEWALRLAHRARLFMFSNGCIPNDHLEVMLSHPDFKSVIAPAIQEIAEAMKSGSLTFDHVTQSQMALPEATHE